MFEYTIQLSYSEKAILNEALSQGELGSYLEKNNEEEKAMQSYKKAIEFLEKNIKVLSIEKQTIFQTMIDSYKERVSVIQNFQKRKSFSSIDDTFLYTHKSILTKPTNLRHEYNENLENNNLEKKKNEKKSKNNKSKTEDINFFVNFKLKQKNEKDQSNKQKEKVCSIEDALNILNELEKIELLLQIIEKTMTTGGPLTKNLYVPSYIWQIEINDLVIEEMEKIKMKYFKVISDEISIILHDENNLHKIKKELMILMSNLINLYKEEKFQSILNVSKSKKTVFENYKDIIKKNFNKLNLYITSGAKKNNYFEVALSVVQKAKKLVEILKKIQKTSGENDEALNKNCTFFYLFFKNALMKIFITDLELRLNQYLVLIRKNVLEK